MRRVCRVDTGYWEGIGSDGRVAGWRTAKLRAARRRRQGRLMARPGVPSTFAGLPVQCRRRRHRFRGGEMDVCRACAEYARTMAPKANALGDFLRARRDQVHPEDVGLIPGGQRRAPGLRREELAMLAGISSEYYLRLERGRAHNPSAQILDALARALQLDIKATRYLHQLANPTTSRWDQSVLEVAAEGLDPADRSVPVPGNRGQ